MAEDLTGYSERARDHYRNPRNRGEISDPDGAAQTGSLEDGEYLRITLRVRDERIADVRFVGHGCPAALACASMTTELARGRHLDEAWEVTSDAVLEALGRLPEEKVHCSLTAPTVLHAAIMNYVVRSVEAERGGAPGGGHAPTE